MRPTSETIRIDDMRLFVAVAEAGSFTQAARKLGTPKQTLSRRIAELEGQLDVQLLERTTRKLRLTDVGVVYAARCAEVVRLAQEATQAVTDARQEPSGLLRVTADPLFGEAFLAPLVIEYARRFPRVQVEVVLTRRRVDLVEEGFDAAFRIGQVDDKRLTSTKLGPARVRYCATPSYVRRRGSPSNARELLSHDCLAVSSEGEAGRWPVATKRGVTIVPVRGRLRFNSFALAYAATLAGLGIGLFPDFACAHDLRRKRLVAVLHPEGLDVGAVWLLYPIQRYPATKIRSFVDLAIERLGRSPRWA